MRNLLGGFLGGLTVSILLASMGVNSFEVQLVIASIAVLPFAYELFSQEQPSVTE